MQESNSLNYAGVVTFFKTSQFSSRRELLDGLSRIGLPLFCPEPRTPPAALKDALGEVFPAHRVETLKTRSAYEVVEVNRGDVQNDYRHTMWVAINENRQIETRPYHYDYAQQIATAFNKHLGLVNANAVTQALIGLLHHLKGTHLPGRGNVWWLPEESLPRWREVAAVVEGCPGQGRGNFVYCIRHQMGPDEFRAIKDAITTEVNEDTARLHEEILGGELGERALDNRRAQVGELRSKIALYERILECGLGSLRESLHQAEEAAAAAVILSSTTVGA